jgi:hypothetical protein
VFLAVHKVPILGTSWSVPSPGTTRGAAVGRPTDGVFAEFERAMIRERVKARLERARAQGKTHGRPTISTATDAAIRRTLLGCDAGKPSFLLLLLFGASVAVHWASTVAAIA